MEVYDRAHELARALARSNEYIDFRLNRAKLESSAKNIEMLQDFRKRQIALELSVIRGEEPDPVLRKEMEESYRLIQFNPTITDYLAAEERMARLLADIQKILMDAIPELGREASAVDKGNQ